MSLDAFAVVASSLMGLESLLICPEGIEISLDPMLIALGVKSNIASALGELNSSVTSLPGFERSFGSVLIKESFENSAAVGLEAALVVGLAEGIFVIIVLAAVVRLASVIVDGVVLFGRRPLHNSKKNFFCNKQ